MSDNDRVAGAAEVPDRVSFVFKPWMLAIIIPLVILVAAWLFVLPATAVDYQTAIVSTATVKVETSDLGIAFLPQGDEIRGLGFIFYPGDRIPPEAYAYLGRSLADSGFPSIVCSMPLGFASLDADKAGRVMARFPDVKRWVLSGHSAGGAMASVFAAKEAARVEGLVLLASIPAADLSGLAIPVLGISASADGVASQERVEASKKLLPGTAYYVEIMGGNHAQFGSYGAQWGDGAAQMEGGDQRSIVESRVLRYLEKLDEPLNP